MAESDKKTVSVKINGEPCEVEAGCSVLQVCEAKGIGIPHFCYHHRLSIAGNCRMCLVRVSTSPKLVIACATTVTPDMEIDTLSDEVVKARESVMEFLLINHPLDCPICDRAGECRLQDYAYRYGRSTGRFEESKVTKTSATFGQHVKYFGSRCIACMRCVRFTHEISGTDELAPVKRGVHTEISLYPGKLMNHPLSMNVVDLCPVGALASGDFLYQARVWFLKSKKSICADCSLGCSIRADRDEHHQIKRIVPQKNPMVNDDWMCDHGRVHFSDLYKNRITSPRVEGNSVSLTQAVDAASQMIRGKKVSLLLSAWTTEEGLKLAKHFAEQVSASVAVFGNPVKEDMRFKSFTIQGDKNPNSFSLKEIFSLSIASEEESGLKSISGDLLVVISDVSGLKVSETLKQCIDKFSKIIVLDFHENEITTHPKTCIVLPGLSHFEKSGTFVNYKGIRQAFAPVIPPLFKGISESDFLQSLIDKLKAE